MAYASCPACGGDGSDLGTLGFLRQYRCRNCGMEFSRKSRRRVKKVAPLPRAKVRWAKRGGKLVGAYKSFRAVVWDQHGPVDAPMAHLYQFRVTNRKGAWTAQGSASRLDNAMRYVEEHMKGVAGNPMTVRETRDVIQSARFAARLGRAADQPTKSHMLGIAEGQAHVALWKGRGRKERRRASDMEDAIRSLSMGGPRLRDGHRTIRRNAPCKGRSCKNPHHRRSLRNRPIDTAWTGKKADFISKKADYGAAPYSELAMHTGAAGARIVRYALFSDASRWPWVTWAHVETSTGQVLDGTAGEVLPTDVRRKLGGFGNEKMPMAARLKR